MLPELDSPSLTPEEAQERIDEALTDDTRAIEIVEELFAIAKDEAERPLSLTRLDHAHTAWLIATASDARHYPSRMKQAREALDSAIEYEQAHAHKTIAADAIRTIWKQE